MPESRGECDVDFLQSAVGDIVDGGRHPGRQSWLECRLVPFQPAKRTCYNHFIELCLIAASSFDGDLAQLFFSSSRGFN